MKINFSKIGIYAFAAVIGMSSLTSCGGATSEDEAKTSKKGAWTEEDKERAITELNSKRDEMVDMIGEDNTDKIFDCAMEKIQANYDNFQEANSDYEGMREIGADCMKELLANGASIKGMWSEEDLDKARAELESSRETLEALVGAETTDEFIECVLERVQAEYANFLEADSDFEGMEAIGEECMTSLL